jgi:ribonuclease HI
MEQYIRVYTDGSAIGNPGPGGWGAVLVQGQKRWEMSGSIAWTTISEMELMAAVHPLRTIPSGARVDLRSDSELLIRGMRYLTDRWRSQAWKNRRGTPIQHRECWQELIALNDSLRIQWSWLKGHNNHPLQCRADQLAYQAANQHRVRKRAA